MSNPINNYEIGKMIGKGSYGSVYLVHRKSDGGTYVMKRMKIGNISDKEFESFQTEVRLLSELEHPGIVGHIESFLDSDKSHLCIVMGYCEGGDLTNFLKMKKNVKLPEREIMYHFVQMALALNYMHDKNILHRDLKTQNIFIKNGLIQLGDFGISKVLSKSSDFAQTCIGTPYYMSPELFKNKPYNFKSDVWALGCVLYEMTTLKHAFDAQSLNGLASKIIAGSFVAIPNTYSKSLRDLIKSMLAVNPNARPTIQQILSMPFVRKRLHKFALSVFLSPEGFRPCDIASLRAQIQRIGFHDILQDVEKQQRELAAANGAVPDKNGKGKSSVDSQAHKRQLEQLEQEEAARKQLENALRKLQDENHKRIQNMEKKKSRREQDKREPEKKRPSNPSAAVAPAPSAAAVAAGIKAIDVNAAPMPMPVKKKASPATPKLAPVMPPPAPIAAKRPAHLPNPRLIEAQKRREQFEKEKKQLEIERKKKEEKEQKELAQAAERKRVRELEAWERKKAQDKADAAAAAAAAHAKRERDVAAELERRRIEHEQQMQQEKEELERIRAEREWLQKKVREMDEEHKALKGDVDSHRGTPISSSPAMSASSSPRSRDGKKHHHLPNKPSNAEMSDKERVIQAKLQKRREEEAKAAQQLRDARKEYHMERQIAQQRNKELYSSSPSSSHVDIPEIEDETETEDISEEEEYRAIEEESRVLSAMQEELVNQTRRIQQLRNSVQVTRQVELRTEDDDEDQLEEIEEEDDEFDQPEFSTGRLEDRLKLIARECVSKLGQDVFIKAYQYLVATSDDNYNQPDEEVKMSKLEQIMGPDKVKYWKLIDKLIFMEANR